MESISLVKACQEYFSSPPHGRKIDIPEFKALTQEDKVELREMLIGQGYDVKPLPDPENMTA
jgi:uncharacterized protein YcgL (UPF0745 family)